MSRRERTLLLDDRPLIFLPAVARAVGSTNRALILQQIHYWLGVVQGGVDWGGHHWTWQSISALCDQLGNTVDERTLRREISAMENLRVLVSMPRGAIDPRCDPRDRTKAYRIDESVLRQLSDVAEATREAPLA